ncbi:MAG: hypothetical protein JNK14_06165 [Chitinophagaceae bacterium]|nr:hypothetical protein [Chitinophagaceae bacterium]
MLIPLLMGRVSYELLNSYWPYAKDIHDASAGTVDYSNWYNKASKVVILKTMSTGTMDDAIIFRDNIPEEITAIRFTRLAIITLRSSVSIPKRLSS